MSDEEREAPSPLFLDVVELFENAGVDVRGEYWTGYGGGDYLGAELVILTANGPRHVKSVRLIGGREGPSGFAGDLEGAQILVELWPDPPADDWREVVLEERREAKDSDEP